MISKKKAALGLVSGGLLCLAAASLTYILRPAVVDSGGGRAESASFQVEASIGGPVIVTGAASGQTASSPAYTCEVGGISVVEGPPPAAPSGGGDDGGCGATGEKASPLALLVPFGMLLLLRRRRTALT
jgi:uncharacterized protein (TIGR03382 family)